MILCSTCFVRRRPQQAEFWSRAVRGFNEGLLLRKQAALFDADEETSPPSGGGGIYCLSLLFYGARYTKQKRI